jgi:hypothetical protein
MSYIVLIALAIWVYLLSSRIHALEEQLKAREKKPVAEPQSAAVPMTPEGVPIVAAQPAPQPSPSAQYTDTKEPGELRVVRAFFSWCAEDWLMKLGGLLVLLGVGWFVSYAFANNWIGPVGRISLGLVVGALVLALGRYRMRRFLAQGGVVMVVGATILTATLFAARTVYDFFTPGSVLVALFLVASLLAYTAVQLSRRPLAYANMLLAGVAPLLVASKEPSVEGLFAYLLVFCASTLLVVARTGWRELVLISLGVVAVHSAAVLGMGGPNDQSTGLMFAYVFTAVFFLSSVLGMIRTQSKRLVDLGTALGTALFILVWIVAAAPDHWQSILCLGWALVFAVGAFLVFQRTAIPEHFYVYGAAAGVLIVVATTLEFEGAALTIVFTGEAMALTILGYLITRRASILPVLSLSYGIPIILSFAHVNSRAWDDGAVHADSAALLVLMISIAAVSFFFLWVRLSLRDVALAHTLKLLQEAAWAVFGVYAVVLIWLVSHAVFMGDIGTTVALIVYALAGCAFYIYGKSTRDEWALLVAGVLVALVVGRLLVVEIWDMELVGRIITFMIIGTLLMSVAWLERSTFAKNTS